MTMGVRTFSSRTRLSLQGQLAPLFCSSHKIRSRVLYSFGRDFCRVNGVEHCEQWFSALEDLRIEDRTNIKFIGYFDNSDKYCAVYTELFVDTVSA
jgi:hypothetical protein